MKILDLFSGCGGMSLGFENAGFQVVAAYDSWEAAVETYNEIFEDTCFKVDLGDVENLDTFKESKPDMIIGGPPCQDFSSAGKRDENLGRADLTISFAEIVIGVSPEWFVMENVERIKKSPILDTVKSMFSDAGYGLTEKVLNASYCGVPQARKRFFLIGKKGEKDNFLASHLEANLSKKAMTVADYFGDDLNTEFYYRHPRSYQRRGIFSIHEPSATIRGVNRPIPSTYKCHSGDATKDLSKVRVLSTKERGYIQTFPPSFTFVCKSKSKQEQLIGNAVPVKLAEYLGVSIRNYINGVELKSLDLKSQLTLFGKA